MNERAAPYLRHAVPYRNALLGVWHGPAPAPAPPVGALRGVAVKHLTLAVGEMLPAESLSVEIRKLES